MKLDPNIILRIKYVGGRVQTVLMHRLPWTHYFAGAEVESICVDMAPPEPELWKITGRVRIQLRGPGPAGAFETMTLTADRSAESKDSAEQRLSRWLSFLSLEHGLVGIHWNHDLKIVPAKVADA
jgi:hypothetical protein